MSSGTYNDTLCRSHKFDCRIRWPSGLGQRKLAKNGQLMSSGEKTRGVTHIVNIMEDVFPRMDLGFLERPKILQHSSTNRLRMQ